MIEFSRSGDHKRVLVDPAAVVGVEEVTKYETSILLASGATVAVAEAYATVKMQIVGARE